MSALRQKRTLSSALLTDLEWVVVEAMTLLERQNVQVDRAWPRRTGPTGLAEPEKCLKGDWAEQAERTRT